MTLTAADQGALLGALGEMSAASDEFARTAAVVIRKLVPCDVLTYNVIDLATHHTDAVFEPPESEAPITALRDVWDEHSHQNPIFAHCMATGDTMPLRYRDVDGGDRFPDTELHRDFYAPLGLHDQLALVLPAPSNLVIAIALNRAAPASFTDRDVEVLAAIRPHLIFHHRTSLVARLLAEGTTVGAHVMLLGEGGRVESLSHVDRTNTFVVGRPVPATVIDEMATAPIGELFDVMLDGSRWTLGCGFTDTAPGVLVAIRSDRSSAIDSLTDREREVALTLADGGTNAQLAERLEISHGTLRKHLQRIFHKLDVADRASAIAVIRSERPVRT